MVLSALSSKMKFTTITCLTWQDLTWLCFALMWNLTQHACFNLVYKVEHFFLICEVLQCHHTYCVCYEDKIWLWSFYTEAIMRYVRLFPPSWRELQEAALYVRWCNNRLCALQLHKWANRMTTGWNNTIRLSTYAPCRRTFVFTVCTWTNYRTVHDKFTAMDM